MLIETNALPISQATVQTDSPNGAGCPRLLEITELINSNNDAGKLIDQR